MTQTAPYNGPLSGLKVIDFGWYYAGPAAAMMLADQGATVVRITKPRDKELPDQQYRVFNRNKKLLELDLKTEDGKAQALSLIEKADVLIENFRPGVMARLGLDYASVKKVNPAIVYLSLPGFASTDKERRHFQAWEGVLGAACGLFTETSTCRNLGNFPPVYTWVPQCSIYGAINGVTGVMAALNARETTGQGTVVEVPLADAGLTGHSGVCITSKVGPSGSVPRALADTNDVGNVPQGLSPMIWSAGDSREVTEGKLEQLRKIMQSPSSTKPFLCADGRLIKSSIYFTQYIARRFFKTLGIDKTLRQEGFCYESPWALDQDNNLANIGGLSPERKARMEELMAEAYLTKPAVEWERALAEAGVPVGVIRTREEWLALEALEQSGLFARMDKEGNEYVVSGRLVDVSGAEGALRPVTAAEPELISASAAETLLGEKAAPKPVATAARPLRKGDMLKGVKVLDLANVIAGPTAGHTLAEFGAEVIKADSPENSYNPLLISAMIGLNVGKRSILTDVKTGPGREVFERLIRWADIVVHNVLDDTARRLGIAHDQLQKINPDIISCQMSAYGGTFRGGWENQGGFDNILQGASGLMAQFGSLEKPHMHGWVSCGDVPGGVSLALSALMALYQKRKTGVAGEGRTSLARSMNYMQLPYMIAENGKSDWGEARGQFAVGEKPHQRMYACADDWLYVGTSDEDASKLSSLVIGADTLNEKAMEKAFASKGWAEWHKLLSDAGIACARVMNGNSIYEACGVHHVGNEEANEEASGATEIICQDDHPCGYPSTTLAPDHIRIGENQSYMRLHVAPRLGAQTREILAELGYSESEIAELVRLKVSHDYYPPLGSTKAYITVENV